VVREGVGAGGEMNQALYAHMNNKRKRKKEKKDYRSIFLMSS
jgi:NaMN:DMB phosphoribosyltransferase